MKRISKTNVFKADLLNSKPWKYENNISKRLMIKLFGLGRCRPIAYFYLH